MADHKPYDGDGHGVRLNVTRPRLRNKLPNRGVEVRSMTTMTMLLLIMEKER
jgi:hypothetical protein